MSDYDIQIEQLKIKAIKKYPAIVIIAGYFLIFS